MKNIQKTTDKLSMDGTYDFMRQHDFFNMEKQNFSDDNETNQSKEEKISPKHQSENALKHKLH